MLHLRECIEYAKSNRSRCGECNKYIDDKNLRVGTPGQMFDDSFLPSFQWCHFECYKINPRRFWSPDQFQGHRSLTKTDQLAFKQKFINTERALIPLKPPTKLGKKKQKKDVGPELSKDFHKLALLGDLQSLPPEKLEGVVKKLKVYEIQALMVYNNQYPLGDDLRGRLIQIVNTGCLPRCDCGSFLMLVSAPKSKGLKRYECAGTYDGALYQPCPLVPPMTDEEILPKLSCFLVPIFLIDLVAAELKKWRKRKPKKQLYEYLLEAHEAFFSAVFPWMVAAVNKDVAPLVLEYVGCRSLKVFSSRSDKTHALQHADASSSSSSSSSGGGSAVRKGTKRTAADVSEPGNDQKNNKKKCVEKKTATKKKKK